MAYLLRDRERERRLYYSSNASSSEMPDDPPTSSELPFGRYLVYSGLGWLVHVTKNKFGNVSPTTTVTVSLSPCEFRFPFEVSACLCFLERQHPRLVWGRFHARGRGSFPGLSLMLGWAWAK